MKSLSVMAILVLLSVSSIAQNKLETIATFPNERPGNITVATDGRVFVTISALSSSKYMVKEILPDGTARPFGEGAWIMKPKKNSMKGISSTIGIQADGKGMLWVLDMGDLPVGQPPKLVGFSLSDGKMEKVFLIPATALTDKPSTQGLCPHRHLAACEGTSHGYLYFSTLPYYYHFRNFDNG